MNDNVCGFHEVEEATMFMPNLLKVGFVKEEKEVTLTFGVDGVELGFAIDASDAQHLVDKIQATLRIIGE